MPKAFYNGIETEVPELEEIAESFLKAKESKDTPPEKSYTPPTQEVDSKPKEYTRVCFRCHAEVKIKRIGFLNYEVSEKGFACHSCRIFIHKKLKKLYAGLS